MPRMNPAFVLVAMLVFRNTARADEQSDAVRAACPGFAEATERLRVSQPLLPSIPPAPPTDALLGDALQRMAQDDQAVRRAWRPSLSARENEELAQRVFETDDRNLSQLHFIAMLYGFPDDRQVGAAGVSAMWLLVQHADADPEFQSRMLDRLVARGVSDTLPAESIAMLTDRVLLAQGKPQRFGSQFSFDGGKWTMRPAEDAAHLDQRRARMGMPPVDDYLCAMRAIYGDSSTRHADGAP